jgi:ribosomal protein S18 acetylase RimI-like enzyme
MKPIRIEHDPSQGVVVANDLHTHDRVGIIFYDNHGQTVIINWLSTDSSSRRTGVATRMLDYVRSHINNNITFGTQTNNMVARAFYKNYGFQEVGRVRLEPNSIILRYVSYTSVGGPPKCALTEGGESEDNER